MPNTLRRLAFGAALLLLAASAPTRPAAASDDPADDPYAAALDRVLGVERQFTDTLAKVRPASVSVLIKKRPPVQPGQRPQEPVLAGCGSGVVVTYGGKTWILTNFHVAGEADALEVITLDGKSWPAEVFDSVKEYDIALLKFSGKTTGIKGVPILPRASKDLAEGQWVVATGNPFFLAMDGGSVCTFGVISGLDRVLGAGFVYGKAIQHDAAVNPGNSGGPLWNLKGELIGINGMIASRGAGGIGAANTGASFSIPIAQLEPYLSALTSARKDAQAGFLGLRCETATDAKGSPSGARVTAIDPRSPARSGSKALFRDDVITSISFGGKVTQIQTATDLVNALTLCPAGTQVTLHYKRGRSPATWTGKLLAEQ